METEAFAAPGTFWRGNIHTHSNRSDGTLPPEEVCRRYREAGYDFLCLSDHFLPRYGFPIVDTRPFRTNAFTTILGAEIHAPANSHGEIWHILAAGLPEDFAPTAEGETGEALAARAKAAGAFVGIAHPQWSGLTGEDGRAMAPHAHAVEIFNTGCQLESTRGDGTYLLDQLLNDGRRLAAYAADDAHFRFPDAFGGWMMVKAADKEPEALVAAMKAGQFYSSQGPIIHAFAVDNGEARVECSAVANIALVGRGTRAVHVRQDDLAAAVLPTEKFTGDWCRLVITDAAGRSAWSNPVWL
jgi:hypothetical protein